jgi:hypothetical protein
LCLLSLEVIGVTAEWNLLVTSVSIPVYMESSGTIQMWCPRLFSEEA